jgi:hypothetical protein
MYYFVPPPLGSVTPARLYGSEALARFLTPPPRDGEGRPVFEIGAPVGVDLTFDPDRSEVVNDAGAWSSPATTDPSDDAIVIPAGTVLPVGLLTIRPTEPGWRDAPPVPENRPPVVDPFNPSHLARYLDSILEESR